VAASEDKEDHAAREVACFEVLRVPSTLVAGRPLPLCPQSSPPVGSSHKVAYRHLSWRRSIEINCATRFVHRRSFHNAHTIQSWTRRLPCTRHAQELVQAGRSFDGILDVIAIAG
jgi:hypothetical protein